MALQNTITIPNTGVQIQNSYQRILSVTFEAEVSVGLVVQTYENAAARAANTPVPGLLKGYTFLASEQIYTDYLSETELKKPGKSFLSQCYLLLKTLPEYQASTDI